MLSENGDYYSHFFVRKYYKDTKSFANYQFIVLIFIKLTLFMNTTQIGTEFENKVFKYFASLLKKDEIAIASKLHSKIHRHRQYPTLATDRKIEFDITIETENPFKKGEWSSLIVIECKCYNNKVETGDFDEFEGKLHKISFSGIKGIMVTTKGFSQTIIEQANKAHIGLVVFSDNDVQWLVSRDTNYEPEKLMLILQGYNKVGIMPVSYMEHRFFNIPDLLKELGAEITNSHIIHIPFLNKDKIQDQAETLRKTSNLESDDIAGEILSKVFPQFRITSMDLPKGLLGSLSLKEHLITISNEIINNVPRRNFTLAHEIGHLCLHKDFLTKYIGNIQEYDENIVTALPDKIIRQMEVQANLFASYLLMPKHQFLNEIRNLFSIHLITTGKLFLDHQPCNKRDVSTIITALSSHFNVSKAAVKMRLINDGLLIIDNSYEPHRISRII